MRRSSYDVYKDFYGQYTKGGRAAGKMLTEKQFEKVKERYAGSGQNVSRRIVADQMELSNRQMKVAKKLQREALTVAEKERREKEKLLKPERGIKAEKKSIKEIVREQMKNQPDTRKMTRDEFGEYVKKLRETGYSDQEINEAIGSPKERKVSK